MPAIIGAFNLLTPATITTTLAPAPTAGSASPLTTATSTGIPSWATVTASGGITVSKPPTPVGPTGGTNNSSNGMVPVSGYTGYRNVVNAIRNNNPPGISDSDWSLTFQPNTTFDKNVSSLIQDPADPSITCNAQGALVNNSGQYISAVVWLSVAGGQLAQVGYQVFSMGASQSTKILWVSTTTTTGTSSSASSGTSTVPVSAPVPASPRL